MSDCKPIGTPMEPNCHLSKSMCPEVGSEEQKEMANVPYRSCVMSLMYLALISRPDIAFAVKELSKFQQNPGREHWKAAKRVLRYLKGTLDYGLMYDGLKAKSGLINISDSDWAGCIDTRNSTIGSLHYWDDMLVSWFCRQRKTALSSSEAEYIGLSEACKEIMYLRQLLASVDENFDLNQPSELQGDNQGALAIAVDPISHDKVKHIDIRYHFIREQVEDGVVKLKYVPTEDMLADFLTKPQPGPCFKENVERIMTSSNV